MSVTILLKNDTYLIQGRGSNIPLHRLNEQFSKSELMADVLNKSLVVNTAHKPIEVVSSPSFLSYAVSRDYLKKYLQYKSEQITSDKFNLLLGEVKLLEHKLEHQTELFRVLLAQIEGINSTVNQSSAIRLLDVAELFPSYKISTLRNKLGRNSQLDESTNVKHSYLKIDGFFLPFRKYGGSKQWLADNIDFLVEKDKAGDYDLQRRSEERSKKYKPNKTNPRTTEENPNAENNDPAN